MPNLVLDREAPDGVAGVRPAAAVDQELGHGEAAEISRVPGGTSDKSSVPREIYTAPTVDAATARFAEFAEHWRDRYPAMIATRERAWDESVPFLAFPVELRHIAYTTNAIESLNARCRKAVRHRGHFPTEQSALKVLYLVATERGLNRSNPTGQICGWQQMLNALTMQCGDRIEAAAPRTLSRQVARAADPPLHVRR